MGTIVPYPRTRHRPFVLKHARNVAGKRADVGERYLADQLQIQRETMLKRGIAPEIVEQEVKSLELAIRAAIWRCVLTPGGAA